MGMNVRQAITEAIQAEKSTENLYRGLEGKFSADPEVAAFWKQFAQEEAAHSEWLKKLAGRLSESDLEKLVDAQTQDLFYEVRLFAWEKTLNNVRNLADAFEAVNDLENGETNAVFRFLIESFEVDKSIRDFLLAQLTTHIDRLSSNLPVAFRDIQSRQAIKAN